MQIHTDEGAEIVGRLGFLADAVPAIRRHHRTRRYRGSRLGWRASISRSRTRIIHVADTLDAMMNARIYRPGRSL